jgi:predicted phage tail protein
MNDKIIRGAGGGGGSESRTPIEAPDSLHSIAFAHILDLVSEGECVGLVDGMRSVFLEETPIANEDGSLNFNNVRVDLRNGTQDQEHIPTFGGVANEIMVGVELKFDDPWVQALTNLDLSAVHIRLSTPSLSKTNTSNGDITGMAVEYAIDVATDGGPFVERFKGRFNGKTSTKYERGHRIDLPAASDSGWVLRARRITPDATTSAEQSRTFVESYSELIDGKFRYPNSVLVGLHIDAQQFQSIPRRSFHMKGRIIRVPSNYDAETRTYDGIWDGTFQPAYSNNPAWVFFDLATHPRYGLGHLVSDDQLDKWALYQIGKYCDELVDDGNGGTEPRFTCNIYLQREADAYKVMQDLATVFRGITYWGGGMIRAAADMPADPVYLYTNASVEAGKFVYQGSARKTRFNVALVTWNDMSDFGRIKIEHVADEDSIMRYGIQETSIVAVGCTSQGQAQRVGRWALATSRYETQSVSFNVGLEGVIAAPGQYILTADKHRAGQRMGGRIRAPIEFEGEIVSLQVDSVAGINVGDTVTVVLPEVPVEIGTPAVPGDEHWANVTSLLHFDGVDGSTTVEDEKGIVWAASGAAEIDTAQSLHGGASMLFSGGHIVAPSSAAFGFGDEDFTIEGFLRASALGVARCILDTRGGGQGIAVYAYTDIGAGQFTTYSNAGALTYGGFFTLNEFEHFAVVREAGVLRMYLRGEQMASVADARTYAAASSCFVGDNFVSGGGPSQPLSGWLEELRITKGVCRYPGGTTFVPPTLVFPDGEGSPGTPGGEPTGRLTRVETRVVAGTDGANEIFPTEPFSEAPVIGSPFIIQSAEIEAQLWKVVGVKQNAGKLTFSITAVQHNASKFDHVENGEPIVIPDISNLPPRVQLPPSGILITHRFVVTYSTVYTMVTADWEPVENAVAYEASYRMNDGPWSNNIRITDSMIDIPNVPAGTIDVRVNAINASGKRSVPKGERYEVPEAPSRDELPAVELVAVGGVLTIDCMYDRFRYVQAGNASVVFINVPQVKTIILEVISDGVSTLDFPSSVVPVSGVPYTPTAAAGARDVLGLDTINTGALWKMLVQQPSTSFAASILPSPASNTVATDGVTPQQPSVVLTGSTTGGTAPITHAWTRVDASGSANFNISNAAIAAPTLSVPTGTTPYVATTQTWQYTATDADGIVASATVAVTLERTAAGATGLLDTFDGKLVPKIKMAISPNVASGSASFTMLNNGTWEGRNASPDNLVDSDIWTSEFAAGVGDAYNVRYTPTLVAGTAGTISNPAAAFTALTLDRKITLSRSQSGIGTSSSTYDVLVELEEVANPGVVVLSGVVTLKVSTTVDSGA